MAFDKRTLLLPDGTVFGEHMVTTKGDVIIADYAKLDFGFEAPGRVFIGESAEVGTLIAEGDVRVDLFSHVKGDLSSKGSVYLGERVQVDGKLEVENDLDVGDDVKLGQGFTARGWINIRNPVPVVIYIFIYLLQMLGQGRSEEVEKLLADLQDGDSEDNAIAVSDEFFFVPEGSEIRLQDARIKGALDAGIDCRLLGNYQTDGGARLGKGTKLHGSLRAKGDVTLEDFTEVHGDLEADGDIVIGNGVHVYGSVHGRKVELRQTAVIDGTLKAREGLRFVAAAVVEMADKVEDFENGRQEDLLSLL